jgi:anti-sigma factor ChrR (cupin superfamily)
MNMTEPTVAETQLSAPGQTEVIDVASLPWQGSDDVKFKVLWRDEKTGASTVLFKFAPGAKAPMHEHTGIEQTFVLEGSFHDHDSAITAGNFAVRKAGSVHQAFTDEGSLHLAIFSAPNRLVETGELITF